MIRPPTAALISLLAATGLRISEALGLLVSDITPNGLLIRRTKFQKTRLVPLHDTAVTGLARYLMHRQETQLGGERLFVSDDGQPLVYWKVHSVFRTLLKSAVLKPSGSRWPRIHELRQNAEARKMPNRNLRIYRKVLEYRRLAISSGSCVSALFPMFRSCLYRAFRYSSSLSLGRNRACLPVSGFVLASAASFSARWACK